MAATGTLTVGALRVTPARKSTAAAAIAAAATPAILFLALHADHYVERAGLNNRSLMAEFAAQPLCSGSPNTTNNSKGRLQ